MIKLCIQTFKRNPENKRQIALQKESLLTRAWACHTLKTIYMVLYVTFSEHAYWKRDSTDSECTHFKDEQIKQLEDFDVLRIAFVTLLTVSVILNFIAWQYRKVAVALLYLECLSILVEAILFGHHYMHLNLVIVARFTFAEILLSVESLSSITCVTVFATLTQVWKTSFLEQTNGIFD